MERWHTHDKKDESQGYTIIMIKKYLHTWIHGGTSAKALRKFENTIYTLQQAFRHENFRKNVSQIC